MAWPLDPSVYTGLAALLLGHAWLARRRGALRRHYLYFGAGVLLVWAVLETPVDTIGDDYLFSVHMFEHMVLYAWAPPLMLLGLTPAMARRLLEILPPLKLLTSPAVAPILAGAALVGWHYPPAFDLAIANTDAHACEHLTFWVVGLLFWWPLIRSTGGQGSWVLSPLGKVVYLGLGSLPMMAVSLVLQFAPGVLYAPYLHAPRLSTFLTPHNDQTVGGAVMMFMDMTVMLWDALFVFFLWFRSEVEADFVTVARPIAEGSEEWEQMEAYLRSSR